MEITKREIIASVSILAIMFIIGLFISDSINNAHLDDVAKYNKALKITDEEVFKYSMSTNIGNAFVEGDFSTVDPVTYDDLEDSYLYVMQEREEYTRHTREVTYKDSNGKTKTKTEVYYTWDSVATDRKKATKITLLGVEFAINKFSLPSASHIKTVYLDSDTRYKYYAIPKDFHGTIFSYLSENTLQGDNIDVYYKNIAETLDYLTSDASVIFFWIIWIMISCLLAYGFCILDNNWLNS